MVEKIFVISLVVLAGAYTVRRFLRKGGSACGCSGGCSSGGGGGCCGGSQQDIKPLSDCGCSRKS
ncbi:hypothetical protein [Fundidesulfovibrio terrae]|uniref:hypothetical protein n=1 Tax=Fundidesulfovibrio terrae TaxID=2922866 RepID=UPI001FAFF882|nr:hypothetical protein [Fundidesulfovibrio terrae]